MLIQYFPSGPFLTNAYVIACAKTLQAVIIDPSPESGSKIKSFIHQNRYQCKTILLTHSHWDHIACVNELKLEYHAHVYVHLLDAPNLKNPGIDRIPCRVVIEGVEPDGFLEEGMIISIGELRLQVYHTPGHSPGSVCFYDPNHGALISGDTLFKGTIGTLSLPTGQAHLMWNSLAKLGTLPHGTKVFPGHGDPTTIGAEIDLLMNAKRLFS